jgi:hypothetical protein
MKCYRSYSRVVRLKPALLQPYSTSLISVQSKLKVAKPRLEQKMSDLLIKIRRHEDLMPNIHKSSLYYKAATVAAVAIAITELELFRKILLDWTQHRSNPNFKEDAARNPNLYGLPPI